MNDAGSVIVLGVSPTVGWVPVGSPIEEVRKVETLPTIVTLLIALSVASERLVEIIKGVIPFLNQQNQNATQEGWRRAAAQGMAVVAGRVTAIPDRAAVTADAPPQ